MELVRRTLAERRPRPQLCGRGNPVPENKELLIIPDAVHTDLYDGGGKNAIPFDKLADFFKAHLK